MGGRGLVTVSAGGSGYVCGRGGECVCVCVFWSIAAGVVVHGRRWRRRLCECCPSRPDRWPGRGARKRAIDGHLVDPASGFGAVAISTGRCDGGGAWCVVRERLLDDGIEEVSHGAENNRPWRYKAR